MCLFYLQKCKNRKKVKKSAQKMKKCSERAVLTVLRLKQISQVEFWSAGPHLREFFVNARKIRILQEIYGDQKWGHFFSEKFRNGQVRFFSRYGLNQNKLFWSELFGTRKKGDFFSVLRRARKFPKSPKMAPLFFRKFQK